MVAHRGGGGLLVALGAESFPLYACESRCLSLRLPHPKYRRMTGCATWTQATCQGLFATGARSPGELGSSLFGSCSSASFTRR